MNAKVPQIRMVAGFCGLFHAMIESAIFGEMVLNLTKHVIRRLDTILWDLKKRPFYKGLWGFFIRSPAAFCWVIPASGNKKYYISPWEFRRCFCFQNSVMPTQFKKYTNLCIRSRI